MTHNGSTSHRSTKDVRAREQIIFMSMHKDIALDKRDNRNMSIAYYQMVSDYAAEFPKGHWSLIGPCCSEAWYGTHTYKPDGQWNQMAEEMITTFSQSGHSVFRASSALNRGTLNRERRWTIVDKWLC